MKIIDDWLLYLLISKLKKLIATKTNMLTYFILLLLSIVLIKAYNKYGTKWCKSKVCLNGKTAIITGGNAGLGYETALALASRGCRVIIADKNDSQKTKEKIVELTHNPNVISKFLDLASFASIRAFAQEINETEERLDILVNNAGVSAIRNAFSEDGLNKGMQINYFGPFLLTHLLIDLLKKSSPSRIIFVSSGACYFSNLKIETLNYPKMPQVRALDDFCMYANSKLGVLIVSKGFAERLKASEVTCNTLHPGVATTAILDQWVQNHNSILWFTLFAVIKGLFARSPEEAAQSIIHLCLSDQIRTTTGNFFGNCQMAIQPRKVTNEKFCQQVWKESERYCKLAHNEILTS